MRERWEYLRHAGGYYLRVVTGSPKHVYQGSKVIGVIAYVAVGLGALLGLVLNIPPAVVGAIIVALFVLSLLKTNYDNFATLRADRDRRRKDYIDAQLKESEKWLREYRWDRLQECAKAGIELLAELTGQRPDVQVSESGHRQTVDSWVSGCEILLEKEDEFRPELDSFRRPIDLPGVSAGWEFQLADYVGIKVQRLLDISRRVSDRRKAST